MKKNNISKLIVIFLLIFGVAFFKTNFIYAEGSKDISKKGVRGYLETKTNHQTAGVLRYTYIYVYAKKGETVYLASSNLARNSKNSIIVSAPNGTNINIASVTNEKGFIENYEQEKKGPIIYAKDNTTLLQDGGYVPVSFVASSDGVYRIEFINPDATNNNSINPSCVNFNSNWDVNNTKTTAAWDVTVVSKDDKIKNGRIFTDKFALNMGANNAKYYGIFYVLQTDGYIYKIDMNGNDPFGFIFYANRRGILRKFIYDGDIYVQSSYHSYRGSTNDLEEINVAKNRDINGSILNITPYKEDLDETFKIFVNEPDDDLVNYLGITMKKNLGTIVNDELLFDGYGLKDPDSSLIEYGGVFSFKLSDDSEATSYEILITLKDEIGNEKTIVIGNTVDLNKSVQSIYWDGRDNDGIVVPVGKYEANWKVILKSGEIHFPMIDIENNNNGLRVFLLSSENKEYNELPLSYNNHVTQENRNTFEPENNLLYTIGNGIDNSVGDNDSFYNPSLNKGYNAYSDNLGDYTAIDYWTTAQRKVILGKNKIKVFSGVTVEKYDASIEETGDFYLLGGAKYQIQDEAGNILYFSGQNGEYAYEKDSSVEGATSILTSIKNKRMVALGLPEGNYVITEIEAPAGYQKDNNSTQQFTINENIISNVLVTFKDELRTDFIRLATYSSSDTSFSNKLADAQFEILDSKGNKVYFKNTSGSYGYNIYSCIGIINNEEGTSSIVTNSDDYTYLYDLDPNETYTLIETKAPKYHSIMENIEINGKDIGKTLNIVNEPYSKLILGKYATGATISDEYILGDAIFNIYDGDKLVYFNLNSNGEYKYSDSNEPGASPNIRTSKGKKTVIVELPSSNYKIVEIQSPSGYKTAEAITFSIKPNDTKNINIFDDELPTGNLLITKDIIGDISKENLSNEDKENIIFTITGPNNYKTTLKYSEFTNDTYLLEELPTGEYTIDETLLEHDDYIVTTTYSDKYFSINEDEFQNINITSKYIKQEYISLEIIKIWDDKNDFDGIRPDTINVNVKNKNSKVFTHVICSKDDWKYTFKNLPKYSKDGKEITYTIEEEPVDGYVTKIDGNIITNIHKVSENSDNKNQSNTNINSNSNNQQMDNPNTYDNIISYVYLLIFSLVGIIIINKLRKSF